MKLNGATLTMTGDFMPLETPGRGMHEITIRNANDNDMIYLSHDGSTIFGFLNASEARTFHAMSTGKLWVKGTLGELVYWDGTTTT
jgi:hypothetical protein